MRVAPPLLLDLDQAQPAVIEHDDRDRQIETLGDGQLAARHPEAAVAEHAEATSVAAKSRPL